MRIVKKVVAVLVLAALMLSSFGCNQGGEQTGDLAADYVPNVSGNVKITYQLATSEVQKRSVQQLASAFEKEYPDAKVTTDFSRGDTALRISSGDIGDVFFLWEKDVYAYSSVNRALMPLDSYVEAYNIDLSNTYSSVLDFGTVDGQLYMIARDYNHLVLSYNKTAVLAEGLTDPVELEAQDAWTWDTFKSYCQQLTKYENGAYTQVGASLRLAYSCNYIPFMEGWGGKWYDTVNKDVSLYSDEKVLEGIAELISVVESGYIYAEATDGEIYTGEKATPYSNLTRDDVKAYVFQDTEFPSIHMVGNSYENYGLEWDLVSMPKFPTHKVGAGATGFAVYNRTKNPDTAAALCLFILSEDGQIAYNSVEGGSVPNIKSLADDDFWKVPFDIEKVNYGAFTSYPEADTKGLVEMCVPPDVATVITDGMKELIKNHINGVKDYTDTLKEIEETADQVWKTLV